ncbi:MAG: hypothetical protein ACJAUJ_001122 [Salibacteraceae bacterium]
MKKSRLIQGTCKLCQKEKTLNLEHVPPKSAFNSQTRYTEFSWSEKIQKEDPFEVPKGQIKQGGVKFHSFCVDCNNWLGRLYVSSYKDWAEMGAYLLKQGKEPIFVFEAENKNFNRIFKHIISMFIAINDSSFGRENQELIDFVQNEHSTKLSEKYRVFCYLTRGGALRYLQQSVVVDFSVSKLPILCSEISFPPFGYVLTINHKGKLYDLLDITGFSKNDPDRTLNIKCQLTEQKTALEFPLDYRSKEEIVNAINKEKKK